MSRLFASIRNAAISSARAASGIVLNGGGNRRATASARARIAFAASGVIRLVGKLARLAVAADAFCNCGLLRSCFAGLGNRLVADANLFRDGAVGFFRMRRDRLRGEHLRRYVSDVALAARLGLGPALEQQRIMARA